MEASCGLPRCPQDDALQETIGLRGAMEEAVVLTCCPQDDALEETIGLQGAMKESVLPRCPKDDALEETIGLPTGNPELDCRSFKRAHPPFRKNEFKPHCLVWTPFIPLTVAVPWIGHLGITDSEGEVHEFMYGSGSHGNGLSFGPICRYYPLDQHRATAALDSGIDAGYVKIAGFMVHGVCCNNCHSFVAWALDEIAYEGCTEWTMVDIAVRIFFLGRFTNIWMFLYWFVPSCIFFYFMPKFLIYFVLLPLVIFCVPNCIRHKLYDHSCIKKHPTSNDDCSESQNSKGETDGLAEAETAPLKTIMDEIDDEMNKLMNMVT